MRCTHIFKFELINRMVLRRFTLKSIYNTYLNIQHITYSSKEASTLKLLFIDRLLSSIFKLFVLILFKRNKSIEPIVMFYDNFIQNKRRIILCGTLKHQSFSVLKYFQFLFE